MNLGVRVSSNGVPAARAGAAKRSRRLIASQQNKPQEVIQQVHKYFQDQAKPAFGPKTGRFLPAEVNKITHGQLKANLDPYTIETKVGEPLCGNVSVLDSVSYEIKGLGTTSDTKYEIVRNAVEMPRVSSLPLKTAAICSEKAAAST